ncbi:MAG: Na(+)/H(+) antiporter subunit D [Candidatus Latescibacterota bacterium]|nr:Na(+)/H(+) antiporter subunit D [Candidatus Latescibacterota bacterium]
MFDIHPALPMILGGIVLPLLPLSIRRVMLPIIPLIGLWNVYGIPHGQDETIYLAEFQLNILRVDKLSMLFGYLFHIAAFLAAVYSIHLNDRVQPSTGLLYAGSAVGAIFAGDLLTLFIFWELLAITSVFQIWARKTKKAASSGMRYLLMHISSGLLLLVGAILYYQTNETLAFDHLGLGSLSTKLIFLGIGIKCAFPLFHTWLVDSYPEATPTGTVFLSSFTTKTAVYALARGYAGVEELIWIGSAMAMFPIFYAVIENDLRRVLGYSMINQIGFMVVGIGFGEGMGVNGAVAHAFNDVIFKGLLFMSMGAVLLRTGRINGSDLGGLYKSMPWTCGFCIVGASSISAFPLFSGFISKSMVMQAAADQNYLYVWLMLLFASAGVFHHAGIKIPFFAFFGHDQGIRCKEAPKNMVIAMGLGAVLCIGIGSFPDYLYSLLPYAINYEPYTATHVILQLQLLFFSALAFAVLQLTHIYPPELPSTNIDSDWIYRKLLPNLGRNGANFFIQLEKTFNQLLSNTSRLILKVVKYYHGEDGLFSRAWTTSSNSAIVISLLVFYLIYFF